MAGLSLQVIVWVVASPLFRTYDEFDHAYRASAVGYGQWVATPTDATRGTGAFMLAKRDIVEAAMAECLAQQYTVPTDCLPVAAPGAGNGAGNGAVNGAVNGAGNGRQDLVRIPSGAGRYPPVYYALVGWTGRLLDGRAAVLSQRLLGAALCLGLIGASLSLVRRWPNPLPGLTGLALAAPPILIFSTALLAPNGLEMAAGVAWWTAAATLYTCPTPPRATWWVAGLGGSLLALVRPLGVLWLGTSALALLAWWGIGRHSHGRTLWRAHRRPMATVAAVVGCASLAAAAWVVTQRALEVSHFPVKGKEDLLDGVVETSAALPMMLSQLVTAVPFRSTIPPMLSLGMWLMALLVVLAPAVWRAPPRGRRTLIGLASAVVVLPIVIQAPTIATFGFAWQGRYILPLGVGVPILAAALTRPDRQRTRATTDAAAIVVAIAVAQAVVAGTGYPRLMARGAGPLAAAPWPMLSVGATVALFLLGSVLLGAGVLSAAPARAASESVRPEHTGHERPAASTR